MRIGLMIEGQESVSWGDYVELAKACEEWSIESLHRSDHYGSVMGQPGRGSLDAWATIAGLAAVTSKLRLGTLVSPVTFRHPSALAKSVVTADQIAGGGRIELGLGAGWLEAEHRAYGFPFPPVGERFEMLEEQIEIIQRQWEEEILDFEGRHYRIEGLAALPKPQTPPHLIVGGKGRPRGLALAARWADEYNLSMVSLEHCRKAAPAIIRAWEDARRPRPVVSLMTGCVIGTDRIDLLERAHHVAEIRGEDATDPEAYLEGLPRHWLVGTEPEVADQLAQLEDAGVERVMLQYLPHQDLDGVALIAKLGG